jgi:excisionase family DNA binding protein
MVEIKKFILNTERKYYTCVFDNIFLGNGNRYGCKNSEVVSEYENNNPDNIIHNHIDIALLDTPLYCSNCKRYRTEREITKNYCENSLISAREASELLSVHINTVRRLGDKGEIPEHRIGLRGDRRFYWKDIQKYIEMH